MINKDPAILPAHRQFQIIFIIIEMVIRRIIKIIKISGRNIYTLLWVLKE